MKLLYDVQYVPNLDHNQLRVGQFMTRGYSIVFDDQARSIKDKKSGRTIDHVSLTKNKMLPIDISSFKNIALVVQGKNETNMWNLCYGHLNVNGLKILLNKIWILAFQNSLNLTCGKDLYVGSKLGNQLR